MPSYRQAVLALAFLPALFTGCKSADKPAQSTTKATRLFAVTVDSAAFFRRGPQDGRDPDLKLPRDTVVKLIRPSFGYCKVEVVASGERGYVSSEEIRPASSTLVAAAAIPPPDSVAAHSSSDPAAEQFNLDSSDPRLVPPPEELPDVDLPPPALDPQP